MRSDKRRLCKAQVDPTKVGRGRQDIAEPEAAQQMRLQTQGGVLGLHVRVIGVVEAPVLSFPRRLALDREVTEFMENDLS